MADEAISAFAAGCFKSMLLARPTWLPLVPHRSRFHLSDYNIGFIVCWQGGDICLPGGHQEECDDSLVSTAVREAGEEIGILPSQLEVRFFSDKLNVMF